jgi:hypothetical protein
MLRHHEQRWAVSTVVCGTNGNQKNTSADATLVFSLPIRHVTRRFQIDHVIDVRFATSNLG